MVWITKYRRRGLTGEAALRVRPLVGEIRATEEAEILKGRVGTDQAHLPVGYPPQLAMSKLVQRLKGKSSHTLLQEYMGRRRFWGARLWAHGCFVASRGNVTDEVIMAYIARQDQERGDDDFRVAEEVR